MAAGLELRHVVTSLPAAKIPPSQVYTDKYCPRGRWRIAGKSNNLIYLPTGLPPKHLRVRLWLSAMAYVLMQAFRQHCLARTSLAKATVGTIRLTLLKLEPKSLSALEEF
jgi:hypothetical protein